MCKCPIKVKNPRFKAKTFIRGVDKEYLLVPCGHCEECNYQRVQSLTFRAFHEYLNTIMHGGYTIFNTLTYSNNTVPRSGGFTFFCKADLQKFLKRLRIRLDRDGYDVDGHLKYLITCEYGEKNHRCHYHTLFNVTIPNLSPADFDSYVADTWSTLGDELTEKSPLGITDPKDVEKRIVNSIYGIQYVCKYVYKGTSVAQAIKSQPWTHISHYINDWCFNSKGKVLWKDLQDYQIAVAWRAYQMDFPDIEGFQLMPFYLQSKNYGMFFLENCSYDELFDVVRVESKSKEGFTNLQIPMYYYRKVFYSYNKEQKRFILNELGRDYKKHVFQQMEDSFNDFVKMNYHLYDTCYHALYPDSKYDLKDTITIALKGRSLNSFIKYVVYLKDRQISPLHHWLIPENTNNLLKYIDEFTEIVSDDCITQTIADEPAWIYRKELQLFNSGLDDLVRNRETMGIEQTYNQLPCFDGFDKLYSLLQTIKSKYNEFNCNRIQREMKEFHDKKLALSVIRPQNSVVY